jgi:hypothetical protein
MSTRFQDYNPKTPVTAEWLNAVDDLFLSTGSIGSSLVGFQQAGTGAITTSVQTELRREVWAEQFGAVGDGVTVSSTAIQNAKNSLSTGGTLNFGPGTFIVDTDAALLISTSNIKLQGYRGATILKAKDNAGLTSLIALTGNGCTVEDIIIDGNRDNGGIQVGFYGALVDASQIQFKSVEIRHCVGIGMFVGSNTSNPTDITVDNCWLHDNGGTTTTTGIGVGIYGGGTFPVNGMKIINSTIENNYNTVAGFPGDSTATNIIGTNIMVDNCIIRNNHNVQGGQLALTSNGVDGSADGRFIVSNNQIIHTVAVAGENTTAIEIEGRKFSVHDNICQSLNGDGVRIETSGGEGIVHDNVVVCTGNGVNMITVGGTGIRRTMVHHNHILAASTGISLQAGAEVQDVVLDHNFIAGTIATKIAGAANAYLIRGNINYDPGSQTGLVAGASPYNFPKLNYDAIYTCEVLNGISGILVDGVAVSILQRIPIYVPAQEQLTVTWAGSAPSFNINAAQGG